MVVRMGREEEYRIARPCIRIRPMTDAKLVVVWEYGSRMEADVAMSMLEAAGIEGFSQADTAGGMREHLAWSGAGFKILVREEDVAAAREILTAP